jgi:hypothetical protein
MVQSALRDRMRGLFHVDVTPIVPGRRISPSKNGLRFVPAEGKVQCTGEGYAGNEDDSDVLSRARNRAKRERSR